MSILVLNVGSSSVKFATFERATGGARELSRGQSARAAGVSPGDAITDADLALCDDSIRALADVEG